MRRELGIRYSINEIAKFKNPVGRVLDQWSRPNKLRIKFHTNRSYWCYFESRPNVTADVSSLCLKSGNCSILKVAQNDNSNKLLANLFRDVLHKNGINKNCVQFIDRKDRKIVDNLLSKMSGYIDVIVQGVEKDWWPKYEIF